MPGDRLALGRELSRLPCVVRVQQRDPIAVPDPRERGITSRGGPLAALVVDDGLLVRRAGLVERRPKRFVEERRWWFDGDDQADAHR